jgi:YesN/AraC family two-component response regulator
MTTESSANPSISLLIVEDCAITLKCYANILSMQCPEVTVYTASNGETGLELFKAHLPDIVLTDLHMPEMDGRQMAENIRAIRPETRVIILTGDKDRLEIKELVGKVVAFDHVLEKPINFQKLFAAITQCINETAQYGSRPVVK